MREKLIKKYNVIAIICARGGSKGLKDKNLKLLAGIPLIGRVINHAIELNCIDNVIVSTDDEKIKKVALEYGAEVPFIRPKDISGDLATTEDTLKHALLTYEELKQKKYDIAVFITATDIFRKPEWIEKAISILKDSPDLESVFVGHKTHKNFWEKNDEGYWQRLRPWMAEYSSRQVRRFVVREDTGLACASRAYLWREGRRIGDKVEILLNDDDFTGIDIHSQDDLELAEAALKIRGGN